MVYLHSPLFQSFREICLAQLKIQESSDEIFYIKKEGAFMKKEANWVEAYEAIHNELPALASMRVPFQ